MDDFWQQVAKSFLMSAISSFLQYLRYRHTQTSSGNIENTQLPLRRDPFVDPSPPLFGFQHILWEPLCYINEPIVVLSCGENYFLLLV